MSHLILTFSKLWINYKILLTNTTPICIIG
nr:MAG TPA: hypothetical protein [Caudoviricetes sp.]